jgi:hypothetical protein
MQPWPSVAKKWNLGSKPAFWWGVTLLFVNVLKMLKILLLWTRRINNLSLFLPTYTHAEYTPEDPKIMTKCSHHFHLGCIYEWMERSDSCPVCGKVTIVALFSSNLLIQFSIFILEIYQSVHFLVLEIFQYCLTSPPGYWNHFYEVETWEVYRKPNFFVPFGSLSFEKNFRLFFFFYPQIHVCLHTFCCEASQNRWIEIFFLAIGLLLKWHRQQQVGGICGVWGVSQRLCLTAKKLINKSEI